MPSSYTPRNRLEQQTPGENNNTWGARLNDNMIAILDEALDGWAAFSLSGPKTLDAADGDPDEARKRVIHITGGTGGTVTLPAVEKAYLVKNDATGTVTFALGTGVTVPVLTGITQWVFTNGTNVFAIAAYDPATNYTAAQVSTLLAAKASLAGGNQFSGRQRVAIVTLIDAATVTPNLADGNAFILTMTANRELANPSGMADAVGQEVLIVFRGAFQPTFGTYYKFPRGLDPTFTGALNAIGGTVISATEILMHGAVGYA
jgi:hypothetical protein